MGHLLQYLMGSTAKKKPSGHRQLPLLLLLAEATQLVQAVAEVQVAHPEEQETQMPLLAKKPALQSQVCWGSTRTRWMAAMHWMHWKTPRTETQVEQKGSAVQLDCTH